MALHLDTVQLSVVSAQYCALHRNMTSDVASRSNNETVLQKSHRASVRFGDIRSIIACIHPPARHEHTHFLLDYRTMRSGRSFSLSLGIDRTYARTRIALHAHITLYSSTAMSKNSPQVYNHYLKSACNIPMISTQSQPSYINNRQNSLPSLAEQ